MSADWIEGRFEGIYSGPRRQLSDARMERDKRRPVRGSAEQRRFGFEIESGRVRDFAPCDEPDRDSVDDDPVIRQNRVKGIRLLDSDGQEAPRETALFDVQISDWQLKHPAEAGDRAYGTIVGTIRARRRPSRDEPARPAATTSAAPGTPPDDLPAAAALPKRVRDERGEAAETEASLGWKLALLLLWIGGGAFWYTCGPGPALVWLAPIAVALVLLWGTAGGFVRRAPWWLVGALPATQAWLVWPSLELVWQTGCWATLGIAELGMLAVPLVFAAVLGSRASLWMTGAVWTAVLCVGCARPEPSVCMATLRTEATTDAEAPTPDRDPRRTDEQGRWPVMPPLAVSGLALPSGPLLELESPPGESPAPLSRPGEGTEAGAAASAAEAFGRVATSGSGPSAMPSLSPVPMSPAPTSPANLEANRLHQAPPTRTDASSAPTADPSQRGARRLTQVDGGWLSPDHRRAPREHVLISVEQANRTPALFFESGGAHRVYVPTDPIFKDGSSELRDDSSLVLARVAALLSLPSKTRVLLEVHCDSAGTPESQIELTRRRAAGIQGWLVDRGHIPRRRFEMVAVGGARPLVPPDGDYAAQQPNRRIELRLADEN